MWMVGVFIVVIAVGGAALIRRDRRAVDALARIEDAHTATQLSTAIGSPHRRLRKIGVAIAGTLIVVVGAVVIGPIPGPGGTVVVAAGLGLLATEFVWARRLLIKVKEQTESMARKTDKAAETASVWWVLFMMLCWVAGCTAMYWVAVRWLPFAIQAFIFATAMGGSTAVGLWAHRMVSFMYKRWRSRREERKLASGVSAEPNGQ